jgi:dTDP-4-dehydrorhamnose 3,5-epimerase
MPFEFEELGLGVILIKPRVFPDNRGYFKEIFKESEFRKMNIPAPKQANVSFSKPGVVRGLHYQLPPKEQGKIVTVMKGRIIDVAVDIRKKSKSFGKYVQAELSDDNHYMLWIPPGFAHGFQALEDSMVLYFVTHSLRLTLIFLSSGFQSLKLYGTFWSHQLSLYYIRPVTL